MQGMASPLRNSKQRIIFSIVIISRSVGWPYLKNNKATFHGSVLLWAVARFQWARAGQAMGRTPNHPSAVAGTQPTKSYVRSLELSRLPKAVL